MQSNALDLCDLSSIFDPKRFKSPWIEFQSRNYRLRMENVAFHSDKIVTLIEMESMKSSQKSSFQWWTVKNRNLNANLLMEMHQRIDKMPFMFYVLQIIAMENQKKKKKLNSFCKVPLQKLLILNSVKMNYELSTPHEKMEIKIIFMLRAN